MMRSITIAIIAFLFFLSSCTSDVSVEKVSTATTNITPNNFKTLFDDERPYTPLVIEVSNGKMTSYIGGYQDGYVDLLNDIETGERYVDSNFPVDETQFQYFLERQDIEDFRSTFLVYFHSEDCKYCKKVNKELLDYAEQGGQLAIISYNVK